MTLIEYRSGLIPLLSFQACSAFHQTVLSAPFLRSSVAEEPFGETLTRYRLRTAIDAIASPPLWQRAARAIGTAVGLIIGVSLLLLSFGAEVFDPWGENGLNLLDLLVGGPLVAAVIAAIGGVVALAGTSPTDVPRDPPPAGTGNTPDAAGAPPAQLNR